MLSASLVELQTVWPSYFYSRVRNWDVFLSYHQKSPDLHRIPWIPQAWCLHMLVRLFFCAHAFICWTLRIAIKNYKTMQYCPYEYTVWQYLGMSLFSNYLLIWDREPTIKDILKNFANGTHHFSTIHYLWIWCWWIF